jgi:hypothetical protein
MAKTSDAARARHLMDCFKLTVEKWDTVSEFQKGLCALCGRPQSGGKRLSTDHSHLDGLFRGLLCSQCNPLLGKLENAFVRLGLHKTGVSLLEIVRRLLQYISSPPASLALGYDHFGYPGRVNTKAHRKRLKREKKAKVVNVPENSGLSERHANDKRAANSRPGGQN